MYIYHVLCIKTLEHIDILLSQAASTIFRLFLKISSNLFLYFINYRKQLPFDKLSEKEKRERRKKFIEQRMIKKNVKLLTLPYDVVTESDVLDILSDFSLDFLLKVSITHNIKTFIHCIPGLWCSYTRPSS